MQEKMQKEIQLYMRFAVYKIYEVDNEHKTYSKNINVCIFRFCYWIFNRIIVVWEMVFCIYALNDF